LDGGEVCGITFEGKWSKNITKWESKDIVPEGKKHGEEIIPQGEKVSKTMKKRSNFESDLLYNLLFCLEVLNTQIELMVSCPFE
jgi:hypothetical protein